MPRLGWRRLHLSLARAPRARLRRHGRPRPPRGAGSRCRRRREALRRGFRRRDRPGRAGGDRVGNARPPLRGHRAVRTAGHRPHGLGSGRDGALPDRLERLDPRHQGAARGRRRAPTARRHPRGDERLLRRSRPRGEDRCDQPRDRPRADQGRDPAAAAAAAPRRRRQPACARRRAAAAATGARGVARRPARIARRQQGRRSRWRHPRRPRVRHAAARGDGEWGPWTLESEHDGLEVRGRRPGDHLAGRRKKVQDLFVDAKVPRAERDAWPVVVCAGEVVAVPGIADAPGWAGVVTARRIAT